MKKISLLLLSLVAIMLVGCTDKKSQDSANDENAAPKAIVLYYSQTGATKSVAEQLQSALNADIEAIEAVIPYSGSYDETIQRCLAERATDSVPAIKPLQANLDDYDLVLLGYPVWFGTCARPVLALLDAYDFKGKTVVTFCTFGSGGLESSTADIVAALPEAEVKAGYGVRNARIAAAPDELNRFLIESGLIKGEIAPLAEFSQSAAVTTDEVKIFNEACGNYMFPLGTPVAAANRSLADGATEYRFTVKTTDAQGNEAEGTIYVVKREGVKAEFTRVVR